MLAMMKASPLFRQLCREFDSTPANTGCVVLMLTMNFALSRKRVFVVRVLLLIDAALRLLLHWWVDCVIGGLFEIGVRNRNTDRIGRCTTTPDQLQGIRAKNQAVARKGVCVHP